MLISSCIQRETKNNDSKNLSVEEGVKYYYTNYHCFDFIKQCELEMLKLINHDTMIYVSSSQFHGYYKEIHGELTEINDSIYFVKPTKHILQRGNGDKPYRLANDSIFFYCDSSLINSNLEIEYLNGEKENYKIYSTENKFWINKDYFNPNNERIYLSFNYKNPIVDETVEIVSKYSEKKYSLIFKSFKPSENFYLIIKKDHIKTLNIGNDGNQCSGPKFKLKRMPMNTLLPGNRKIYKNTTANRVGSP